MEILPAIDLRDGRVVRLYQGDYDRMTIYGLEPAEQAEAFKAAGAEHLHVVDLDGARDGAAVNADAIRQITAIEGLSVEVGGGIRTEMQIEKYLAMGVQRCILGTVAVRNFKFTEQMVKRYGDHIAVGVDARDGYVAVSGWRETSTEKGTDLCRRLADIGVRHVIYTDISRDGAMQGTNLDIYREITGIPDLLVTASGGICTLKELDELQGMGVWGAIVGQALYTGALDLAEALRAVSTIRRRPTW